MKNNFKILKKLIALLLIVPFLSFDGVAYAQATNDNADIAGCVGNAIASGFGANIATNITQELIPTTSVTQNAVVGATGVGAVGTVSGSTVATVETAVSVPVQDAAANIFLGTIEGVTTASSAFQDIGKMQLDALAYKVAQCTLDQLTNNTIKWIQGGFEESPKFAIDTRSLFEDIANGVSADFANQIRNLQVCDFTPNFIDDLADRVDIFPQLRRLPPKIQCPFPAQNVSASQFYNEFSVLGWKGMETSLSDNGNSFGVSILTNDALAARQATAKATSDQKLSWSNGFVDMLETDPSKCNYPSDVYDPYLGWDKKYVPSSPNYVGDATMKFIQRESCPTTTPGKVIGDSLMKAIGAKQDKLGFADNMNKIISALIDELTSEAVHGIFKAANNATPATGPSHNPTYSPVGGSTSGVSTVGSAGPTGTAPYVSTGTAVAITQNGATLTGSIQYPSISGTGWFEWSTSQALLMQSVGNNSSSNPFTYGAGATPSTSYSSMISGLNPGTTYSYRAVGQTSQGIWYGSPQSFKTAP